MNLEDIMFNEMSPTQNDRYCRLHSYEVPRVVKSLETESKVRFPGAAEGENGEVVFNGSVGTKFQFRMMKTILEKDGSDVAPQCECM